MKSSLYSKCATLAALLVAAVLPQTAAAQWRTAYWNTGDGTEPAVGAHLTAVAAKYTHIMQEQIHPTFDGSSCGLEHSQIDSVGASNFINSVHAGGAKALVSLNVDSTHASAMDTCTNATYLDSFVAVVKSYLISNGYDGFDLDWESGLINSQLQSFASAIRSALPSTLLTIAADVTTRNVLASIASKVDQFNFGIYDNDVTDLTGGTLSYAWYQSCLHAPSFNANQTCADGVLGYFVGAGIPASKIGIGPPFYGRIKAGNVAGNCGSYIDTPGQHYCSGNSSTNGRNGISYKSLIGSPYLTDGHGTVVVDSVVGAQYIRYDNGPSTAFVNYTGPEYLKLVAAYAKAKGLGGVMVYDLQFEYLSSQTGDARFPLSTALFNDMVGSGSYAAPSITSTSPLPAGTVGTSYSLQVNATGTPPMTWAVTSGALPNAMALNSNGVISGTPTTAVTSNFTVEAGNASGNSAKQFSLTVNPKSTTVPTWFNIVSKNSGKCLDVTGMSTAENVQLQQWTCWGGDNQKFQFTPVTGGYKITAKNSGLQVNVRGGTSATQNGAAIIQWPYGGASNEIWNTHPNTDGSYSITVLNSGKCMDVTGWSMSNGGPIQQWSCSGGLNQHWTLVPVQ